VDVINTSILNRDEMTGPVLVVEEARKPRRLAARRRGRVRLQLTCELLLQRLNFFDAETRHSPEDVDAIWRRLQDI
jgi:hypothetical protein